MEMAVESAHEIPEATATGVLLIGGQIITIIMVLIYPLSAPKVAENTFIYTNIQTCVFANSTDYHSKSLLTVTNYNTPIYVQTAIYILISILFSILYKCPYFRLRLEPKNLGKKEDSNSDKNYVVS